MVIDMARDPRQRRVDDLTALLEISRQLGATTELTPLLERITEAATQVLGCERATVFLYDAAAHQLCSKAAVGAGEICFNADLGIAGEVVRTGRIVCVPDAYADPRFNREIDQATGFRTRNLLTFPMHGHDHALVGVLQVLNKRRGDFTGYDEELASTLSLLAGVAVQRQMLLDEYAAKQKLERDLAVARQIQQSLLPKAAPRIAGFDIAGFNAPADSTGGDCYDYLPTPDGRFGLLLADAVGHGIGPALLVSQYRAVVRALLAGNGNVAETLDRANDLLAADLPAGMFITSFLGLLNPSSATLEYVSAGQGPLLVYRRGTGEVAELAATTLPLGIIAPLDCATAPPVVLALGDMFLLFTDGFFEWADPDDERFGTERIAETVRRHAEASAAGIIAAVRQSLAHFARGTPQLDDLTAMVVKRG